MKSHNARSFLKSYNGDDYFNNVGIDHTKLECLSSQDEPDLTQLTNNEYSLLQKFIDKSYKYEDHAYETSNFIDFEDHQFIGVDIGMGKIVTCCDNRGRRWYHSNKRQTLLNNRVFDKAVEHYNSVMRLKESSKQNKRKRLKGLNHFFVNQIKGDIRKIIFDIIKFFGPNRIYLLSDILDEHISKDTIYYDIVTINVIKKTVYELFKECVYNSGLNSFVLLANEDKSSIKCTICKHANHKNRTEINSFSCVRCGYYNKNDDIVACINIVNRYISFR